VILVPKLPRDVFELGRRIGYPNLQEKIRRFLFDQFNPNAEQVGQDVPLDECPDFYGNVFIYRSATARFYAPSDISGVGGMHREIIRSTTSWRKGAPRRDFVLLEHTPEKPGFEGLHVARVFLLLSFNFQDVEYPCAFIQWFSCVGDRPDNDTGMWIIEPDTQYPDTIIHLN